MIGGTFAGTSAVHGLQQKSYGQPERSFPSARADAETPDMVQTVAFSDTGVPCDQCSERDLGYRWAALAAVRFPSDCPGDSWGFRRGCLDFVGGI